VFLSCIIDVVMYACYPNPILFNKVLTVINQTQRMQLDFLFFVAITRVDQRKLW
jgi:hypothetical protein